jgi:hypothetical protein
MNIRCALLIALSAMPIAQFAAAEPKEPAKQVIKLTLYPMAEPQPALKYRLLPPFLAQRSGNAAVWWNRIAVEQARYFGDLYREKGPWAKIEKWLAIPVGDPREKELRTKEPVIAETVTAHYADMARAARFESCDWQLPLREGNVITLTLPEVQQARTYGRLIAAKAHLEIVAGRYGEAVETLQTGLALARDIARGQTLINALVGTAIASQQLTQVEQFIKQPGAPNLYWALSALPRPLVDYRVASEVESRFLFLQWPELQDLDKRDLTAAQWQRLLDQILEKTKRAFELTGEDAKQAIAARVLTRLPVAKQYLIAHGRRAAEVEAMPPAKIILLYSTEYYQELSDDQAKIMSLPYVESTALQPEVTRRLQEAKAREIVPFASMLLPAVGAAKHAEVRTEWTVARLQLCEALRLYAAAHDGKLPERLGDITAVPVPRNPLDDQPFGYRREGSTATVTVEHGPRNEAWRYEITMAAK